MSEFDEAQDAEWAAFQKALNEENVKETKERLRHARREYERKWRKARKLRQAICAERGQQEPEDNTRDSAGGDKKN